MGECGLCGKKGQLTKVSAKEHGEDVIVWKNGEVLNIDKSHRLRIEGQKPIKYLKFKEVAKFK